MSRIDVLLIVANIIVAILVSYLVGFRNGLNEKVSNYDTSTRMCLKR